MKKNKLFLSVLLMAAAISFTACSNESSASDSDKTEKEDKKSAETKASDTSTSDSSDIDHEALYSITIVPSTDGSVTADKTRKIKAGETITLTVTPIPDELNDYKLISLKMNETELDVIDNKASFTMPAANVTITAIFGSKYIGTKKPSAVKQVGDIVFNDGSSMPYSRFSALDETTKDKIKTSVIALIFYKGFDLNSDKEDGSIDLSKTRTLGVGLIHSDGLEWCTFNDADACELEIKTIVCKASKTSNEFSYRGDKNGSDNLEQIEAFEGVSDTSDASKYPAFYFAKKYKEKKIAGETESRLKGTEYEDDWYLPSLAELCEICRCMEKKVFDIDTVSSFCGGDKFGSDSYWSSSQRDGKPGFAQGVNFSTQYPIGDPKENDGKLACAIREF